MPQVFRISFGSLAGSTTCGVCLCPGPFRSLDSQFKPALDPAREWPGFLSYHHGIAAWLVFWSSPRELADVASAILHVARGCLFSFGVEDRDMRFDIDPLIVQDALL